MEFGFQNQWNRMIFIFNELSGNSGNINFPRSLKTLSSLANCLV